MLTFQEQPTALAIKLKLFFYCC